MDPTFLPAGKLAEMTRRREIGCLELLDHYIARVARLDGPINAVVVTDFDRARERARMLDQAGERSAPLFGVPMTVKESFDVAGLPSTLGHPERRNHRVQISSIAVRRLEAAGVIIFGKTNVPVDLADWQSYNPLYGTTCNPWNRDHTPGGSSGGSAAALAAGLTGLELGSDIGGSIRVPAHFCGVFGHKPTWTLCSGYGDPATSPAAPTDIASLGPMARSADDLAIALNVLAGPDPDETGLKYALPPPRAAGLKALRVAVWSQEPGQETDTEIVGAIEALATELERFGCTVGRSARPAFDATEAFHIFLQALDAGWSARATEEILQAKRQRLATLDPHDMSADAVMARATDMSHREWLMLNERRMKFRRLWSAFFREWDIVLTPVINTVALPHMQEDRSIVQGRLQGVPRHIQTGPVWERQVAVNERTIAYNDMCFWPGLVGGFHLPVTVVPIGFTKSGLPIGMQISGPIYGDRTTLMAASLFEQAGFTFRPPTLEA
ncbi:MAG TPA: amidase [Acetobacteraceae bacterium]|jgi:amidase|nr:amidase [Acetobacteraceae bacterium]